MRRTAHEIWRDEDKGTREKVEKARREEKREKRREERKERGFG